MNRLVDRVKDDLRTDYTWNRVGRLGARGARALPRATAEYVLDKVPIVSWLPRYNYRWIFNDVIAGLTVGLMLIPQGLSYAKLAGIPVQYGLMSSWLPSAIYAFMGTSKDLSTGPTSLIGLLTSEAVADLQGEFEPVEVASAVALMMGVYGMVLGFLKLGFLLEFISLPILSGFISAVAITIILNQMGSLLGEANVGDGTATQIHDIFHELPNANGYDCAIGFTGIFFLAVLDHAYRRWSGSRVLWLLSITRAFLCLVLFTGVGYAVNKDRASSDDYLFSVAEVQANGQEAPTFPRRELIGRLAGRSVAVFIGSAVEHTAIARGFAVRNGYTADQSQELAYYGVANFFNSFFHAMGVGGAMSRTAVNSACNVRSPLGGLVTTAVVLVSIYRLVGTLYWIPKATLSAIIICAVWPLISSPAVFYRYWKSSLADFISCMLAFWVSLFVSTEIGIASSVGFNIVYIVLRQVFTPVASRGGSGSRGSHGDSSAGREVVVPPPRKPSLEITQDKEESFPMVASTSRDLAIPADTRVFCLGDSVFFANAYAIRSSVLAEIQTHHAPGNSANTNNEGERRSWSVVQEQHTARMRRRAGIPADGSAALPRVAVVVLDFGRANHVDTTAVSHLRDMAAELAKYSDSDVAAGDGADLRFVGMSAYVRERFTRMGWTVEDAPGSDEASTKHYPDVASAVAGPRRRSSLDEKAGAAKTETGDEPGVRSSHKETV